MAIKLRIALALKSHMKSTLRIGTQSVACTVEHSGCFVFRLMRHVTIVDVTKAAPSMWGSS